MKQEKTKPLAKTGAGDKESPALAPQPAERKDEPRPGGGSRATTPEPPKEEAPAADKPTAPALDPENASVRDALAMPPKVEEPRGKVCRYRIAEGQGDLLRNGKHYRPGDELDLPSDVAERLGKLVEPVQ